MYAIVRKNNWIKASRYETKVPQNQYDFMPEISTMEATYILGEVDGEFYREENGLT